MRHGDIKLTMGVYTDPRLLDVAGALDKLPTLPLEGGQTDRAAATGTDNFLPGSSPLAPVLAPTPDFSVHPLSLLSIRPPLNVWWTKRPLGAT